MEKEKWAQSPTPKPGATFNQQLFLKERNNMNLYGYGGGEDVGEGGRKNTI